MRDPRHHFEDSTSRCNRTKTRSWSGGTRNRNAKQPFQVVNSRCSMARFSLLSPQENPKAAATYIDVHRAQLQEHLGRSKIGIFEIEMLAKRWFPQRAEAASRISRDGLSKPNEPPSSNHRQLPAVDPVEARKGSVEQSSQLNDLVNQSTT